MLIPQTPKYLLALGALLIALSLVLGICMEIRLKRANQPKGSRLDLGRRYQKAFPESSMAWYSLACQIVGLLLWFIGALVLRHIQ